MCGWRARGCAFRYCARTARPPRRLRTSGICRVCITCAMRWPQSRLRASWKWRMRRFSARWRALPAWIAVSSAMEKFQPHRYTRTRDCFDDLVKALSSVDALVLTEVYSAGETPLIAADAHALARAVRVAGKVEPLFVETVEEIPEAVMRIARDGDVVITMGAGSMGGVAAQLKQHTLEMKKRDVFNPS